MRKTRWESQMSDTSNRWSPEGRAQLTLETENNLNFNKSIMKQLKTTFNSVLSHFLIPFYFREVYMFA